MLPRFYDVWRETGDKAAALRAAQLTLIAALREGRAAVSTPLGEVVLPEHPALWANLVLIGEP
jgi:CHAT domain-containing protein